MNQQNNPQTAPLALVTGGSAGLGRALTHALVDRGWQVVTTARDPEALARATEGRPGITTLAGDVGSAAHRKALAELVAERSATRPGGLDLLVHNASSLGPTPLPPLATLGPDDLTGVLATNLLAPVALTAALLPLLARGHGVLLSISSDAAIEHYPGWGAYGASKAALDHATLTLAAENELRGYAVDPGDMRTQMHQDAFPNEDISDRPLPGTVVPHLLALIASDLPSGRYRAADIPIPEGAL